MQYIIKAPRQLNQTIKLPASKSISNRALIIHALSGGHVLPKNLSDCDDTEVIIRAFQDMPRVIDVKAAGTAMRFMTAYLATKEGEEHVLTGTERMKHRPIRVLVDALRQLGAVIDYEGEEGFPPLRITGRRLEGGTLEIPGNVSSQFISALLLIGPVLKSGLTLHLTGDIISRPYIDLTLSVMHQYGAVAEWGDYDTINVEPVPYGERDYFIESDWSAASYWYEMMTLSQNDDDRIQLEGLADGSRQGDSSLRYIFSLLGVKTAFDSKQPGQPTLVTLSRRGRPVPRLEYDFINAPDLAQTFVVCCAVMNVPFHFRGLNTLRIKETDRIAALIAEMRKLGYVLHDGDGTELIWSGERCEPAVAQPVPDGQQPVGIDTYEDHRMALAFAPAAFRFDGLRINNPHVVSKSYPHYWDDLRSAGFGIEESEHQHS
ncbi:MAG: 3-phosphoshikimate 1-carboxyvinyltransferase [Prevotella sp.]|nr:3-phosphoshikimate 1-carboxyvinyltransferase [Prevotella sp.]